MANQWTERWERGQIGWHEAGGNASLKKYWQISGRHVLVPFCGKSKDLLWLESQGNEVTGVELSELAVRAFFAENRLEFTAEDGELKMFKAKARRITLFCGDYFALQTGPFDAHYDRGALIALPAERRPAYAQHTSSLLTDSAQQLVIAVQYDQNIASGPPYSVGADEIQEYWPSLRQVVSFDDIANCPPKFRDVGLEAMFEVVWQSA
jgi:thiopurine S-methyltransferase